MHHKNTCVWNEIKFETKNQSSSTPLLCSSCQHDANLQNRTWKGHHYFYAFNLKWWWIFLGLYGWGAASPNPAWVCSDRIEKVFHLGKGNQKIKWWKKVIYLQKKSPAQLQWTNYFPLVHLRIQPYHFYITSHFHIYHLYIKLWSFCWTSSEHKNGHYTAHSSVIRSVSSY